MSWCWLTVRRAYQKLSRLQFCRTKKQHHEELSTMWQRIVYWKIQRQQLFTVNSEKTNILTFLGIMWTDFFFCTPSCSHLLLVFCVLMYNTEREHRTSVTDLLLNPLTSTSDQGRISPYNIKPISSREVIRIKKNVI